MSEKHSGRRVENRWIPGILVLIALLALLTAGCNTTSKSAASNGVPNFDGVAKIPPTPAPPLALRDSLGHPVNLTQFRGKAVLVTFIFDHCRDLCPLTVEYLREAQAQLGPEGRNLQIVAVSVDPRGDTPRTVRTFLRDHRMTGRMEYLIGSRPQLEKVWRDWNILAQAAPKGIDPDRIEHSSLIDGISASGMITTFYSHDFEPSQIVHDVPLLASR
jgi:protein SCO1/2